MARIVYIEVGDESRMGNTMSLFVGVVSGVLPAYRASKLDPVEALLND
jgi:ABC-type lipoprotein release transport system permease subunit